MNSIAISELQKSAKQVFAQTGTVQVVFSHNKRNGGVISEAFLRFIEANHLVEDFEDWVMAEGALFKEDRVIGKKFAENKPSQTYKFDEIF